MISNSLAHQTNAIVRDLEISRVAKELGLNATLKGETVRLTYRGTEHTGVVTSVSCDRRSNTVFGFFITVNGTRMNWSDVTGLTVVAPTLPTCAGFAGTGQRCTTCRVHRNTHA